MERHELDLKGLQCPTPTLKIHNFVMAKQYQPGDVLVARADCDTFEADVRRWCQQMKRVLIVMASEKGAMKRAEIRL